MALNYTERSPHEVDFSEHLVALPNYVPNMEVVTAKGTKITIEGVFNADAFIQDDGTSITVPAVFCALSYAEYFEPANENLASITFRNKTYLIYDFEERPETNLLQLYLRDPQRTQNDGNS